MRAICFIQEVKDSDLTMRQQQLICHRALRKLQWPCVMELLSLRPGMVDLMRAAAAGEVDVLMVIDTEHLHCGQAELDGLLMSLLQYGIHTFGAKNGQWIEPAGRHWMVLPGYDETDE